MADPQVNLLGQDIYALGYVDSILPIHEKKTFQKQFLIINSYDLLVKNYDNFFSVDNPVSIFHGTNWRYTTLQIIDENSEVIWNGIIIDIVRNPVNKTALIQSRDGLFQYRKELIEYTSTAYETGAEAVKNIMDDYSYTDYNQNAIETSITNLNDAGCTLKVDITKEDNVTLLQILDKLAVYCAADCYLHNNQVYFRHWIPYTGGTSIYLTENDILDIIEIKSSENTLINDYNIGYDGDLGVSATDEDNNDIGNASRLKYGIHSLPELRCDTSNSQIWFENLASAVYIGESYIKRTNINYNTQPRPLTSFTARLKYNIQSWITLQTYCYVTFSDEGWNQKLFEIFEFTRDESAHTLTATFYEVIT